MFDPTCFILDSRFGYVVRHEGADYYRRSYVPWRVRFNPLRLTIGIGRGRPCRIVINKNAWMHRKASNFLWRLKTRSRIAIMSETLKPNLREAIEALGAMPEGYCFCSKDRIGDDSKVHEPECADLRAALIHPTPGEDKPLGIEEVVERFMDAIEAAPPSDYRQEGLSLTYGQVERGIRAAIEAYEQARASTGQQP